MRKPSTTSTISAWPTLWCRGRTDASLQDYEISDPHLSELGISQGQELRSHLGQTLPLAQEVGLVVASPMRRTLQTVELALGWLMERGIPVQLRAEWQGIMLFPSCMGLPGYDSNPHSDLAL